MPRRASLPKSTLSALPGAILAAIVLAGCGGTASKSAPTPTPALSAAAARDLPECRKARMLCGEANPSPGIREACLRAARDCREARTPTPQNPSPSSSETTP